MIPSAFVIAHKDRQKNPGRNGGIRVDVGGALGWWVIASPWIGRRPGGWDGLEYLEGYLQREAY
jgi:hypothetical protein